MMAPPDDTGPLRLDEVHLGDARELMGRIPDGSVALSVWSPPYHVGKGYEADQSYDEWRGLLSSVISEHGRVLAPGGFMAVNINDILAFRDESMPRFQANVVAARRCGVTEEEVREAALAHPDYSRRRLAELLGCSEQTVQRRLGGSNVRGGKRHAQTRVRLTGGMVEGFAADAGLYLYDRRVWVKDPAWTSSPWTSKSYRSVDEFEYVYIFWKPGETVVDRGRLTEEEWAEWGSRGVWRIPSVRRNDDHESKFPVELPRRVIRMLTSPGDTVLDCFMGSGSTALAAMAEGRRFIGIDSDPAAVRLARSCIAAARLIGPGADPRRAPSPGPAASSPCPPWTGGCPAGGSGPSP